MALILIVKYCSSINSNIDTGSKQSRLAFKAHDVRSKANNKLLLCVSVQAKYNIIIINNIKPQEASMEWQHNVGSTT